MLDVAIALTFVQGQVGKKNRLLSPSPSRLNHPYTDIDATATNRHSSCISRFNEILLRPMAVALDVVLGALVASSPFALTIG